MIPARYGRTTLANRVRAEVNGQVFITDGILKALQEGLQPEWLPNLFTRIFDPGGLISDPLDRARRLYGVMS